MRADVASDLANIDRSVRVGNVYRSFTTGRAPLAYRTPVFKVLVAVDDHRGVFLSIDADGDIVSGITYKRKMVDKMIPVGFAENIQDIVFAIRGLK